MPQQHEGCYEFGPFRLDSGQKQLFAGGEAVALTPKAFDTLLLLVQNSGRLVSKDELLRTVWPNVVVEEATVAQNVFRLRKVLGEDASGSPYIETIPKRGYRFSAKVHVVESAQGGTHPQSGTAPQGGAPLESRVEPARSSPPAKRLVYLLSIAVIAAVAGLLIWGWWSDRSVRPANGRVMLAVLPVQNLTGDPGQEYLADGLTDEVIADLGRLNPDRLGVIARTSSMAYKQSNKTIQQIARELNVDYVLEASLREGAGQIRFTAQLIRTQDQTHLWAQTYDRPMADILALQSELARTVAEQMRVGLPRAVAARLAVPRAVSPQAYDAYAKGRYFWNRRTTESMTIAERYFQLAIQADPGFAPAYAGLADCYQVMVNLNQLAPQDGFLRARAAVEKALELDDSLAEAHTSLASIKGDYEWDWHGAESEYRRAIALNPNYATARHWYGDFLAGTGRLEQGVTEMRKAAELDPLSAVIRGSLADLDCMSGRCAQAIEELHRLLEMYPDFVEAHQALAEIYAYLGRYPESVAELQKEGDSPGGQIMVLRGYAAARAGRIQEALEVVQRLETDSGAPHTAYWEAIVYTGLGDKDRAFARLESARLARDPYMAYLCSAYVFTDLRSDARFAELVHRMNMPLSSPAPLGPG
jgi:TolB-like protein/DNA-binding winged helix-turn-helix (wHTH) protein/Flp pilus assembly protein TadD